jgi:protein TonB
VSAAAAPIEAPASIEPEPPSAASMEEGVPGGVPGGVAAGIIGGIPGTVEGLIAPPPPVSHQPVRIGGQIQAPALIHRVEPIYPLLAQMSKIDGVVILEAIVGEDGHVRSVKMLRGHPILGKAATDAVTQWQYEPLRLDGMPAAFELTVSLWFHFDDKPKRRL